MVVGVFHQILFSIIGEIANLSGITRKIIGITYHSETSNELYFVISVNGSVKSISMY